MHTCRFQKKESYSRNCNQSKDQNYCALFFEMVDVSTCDQCLEFKPLYTVNLRTHQEQPVLR
ncbi:MAG: hypothetical protein PHW04_09275 [Candidatus Wallbacteria bacterium]|nr:hypothetical protein [Candidatus Wallbacteria bacterium]